MLMPCRRSVLLTTTLCALVTALTTLASANEIQLAGIRLGQHALHLLKVYGQPDGIVEGGGAAGAAVAAGGTTGAPGGGPGMGAGGPGGGPGMPGAGPGGGGPGMGGGMGPGAGAGPGAGMGAAGGMAGPQAGGMGGAVPGAGGAAPTAAAGPIPDWAAPVWMPMLSEETLWVYRRGAVVLGFLLDRDGYVMAICIAGEKCDWARTAVHDPRRAVKLGDDYQRVIERYGYPTRTSPATIGERAWRSANAGPDAGSVGGAYRDLILHYGFNDNIEFLLRDMKVVRIHIWEPDLREPQPRVEGAGGGVAGGGQAAGAPGGMAGQGMSGPGMGAPGMGGQGMGGGGGPMRGAGPGGPGAGMPGGGAMRAPGMGGPG